jgi:hypothetical protein
MKKTILILFILIVNSTFSQKNIDSLYVKYFKIKRENIHLHLNKTSFIPGEEAWFKAYIINNKDKKLSNFTKNLHCYIYDNNKKIIAKKLIYTENGVGNGSFKIDSTYTSNTYYIAANTNWMQNFKEDESFFQKITILNKNSYKNTTDNELDIQILPEGGHYIEASKNTFGLLVKNKNNIGLKINKILLKDNKNKVLKEFSTNNFGLAKFNFYYDSKKEYHLEFDLGNDKVIEKKIPKASEMGITLNIENLIPTYFKININTNKNTLKNIMNKKINLFIHNTNYYFEKEISFKNQNTTISILVPKKKIDTGVNIITLFDNANNPIAERLTYIHNKNLKQEINIEKLKTNNDSLEIKLSKKGLDSSKYFMSASILPINTKSYNPTNSIISKFILAPFIKGSIQNPSYYFKNIDRKKLLQLDLLLLTQGWSKYNWKNIFYETPIIKAESENGITLKGTLNVEKIDKNSKVFLFSSDNNLVLSKEIKGNKFKFSRLYLKDSSEVNFIISKKKKQLKTRGYFQQISNNLNLKTKTYNNQFDFINLDNQNLAHNFIETDRIQLDAINLRLKKKPKNNPFFSGVGFSKVFVLDKNYKGTQNLNSFFMERFYSFRRDHDSNLVLIKSNRQVSVYWDDIILDDLEILNNLNLSEFSEIHYKNREIFLYTNYDFKEKRSIKKMGKLTINGGFTEPKIYYQPKYGNKSSTIFENYGAIYWKPNINMSSINTSFKIPLMDQKHFTIYIEGITASGAYIYEEKDIHLKN